MKSGIGNYIKNSRRVENLTSSLAFLPVHLLSGLKHAKLCGLFALSFMLSFTALFGAPSVSAASIYDGLIRPVDTLQIQCYDSVNSEFESARDISTLYAGWLYENTAGFVDEVNITGDISGVISNFEDRLNDGEGWAVSQAYNDGIYYGAYLAVNRQSNQSAEFIEQHLNGSEPALYAPFADSIVMQCTKTSEGLYRILLFQHEYSIDDMATGATLASDEIGNSNGFEPMQPWFVNMPIIYPNDYEGEVIPDSVTIVPTPEELGMNLHWKVTDRELSIKDISNYGSNIPDECWVQLPNNVQGDNFNEYYYDCSSPEWINHTMPETYQQYTAIQFVKIDNEIVSKSYNIVIDGTIYDSEDDKVGAFENCINTEISWSDPWIFDWDACVGNLAKVSNLLSFGQLKFGNNWEHEASCKELAVLDDWIGLENPNVCPMFNSTIRNTVTPFVTLVLGLITVGFVSRQTGGGFA